MKTSYTISVFITIVSVAVSAKTAAAASTGSVAAVLPAHTSVESVLRNNSKNNTHSESETVLSSSAEHDAEENIEETHYITEEVDASYEDSEATATEESATEEPAAEEPASSTANDTVSEESSEEASSEEVEESSATSEYDGSAAPEPSVTAAPEYSGSTEAASESESEPNGSVSPSHLSIVTESSTAAALEPAATAAPEHESTAGAVLSNFLPGSTTCHSVAPASEVHTSELVSVRYTTITITSSVAAAPAEPSSALPIAPLVSASEPAAEPLSPVEAGENKYSTASVAQSVSLAKPAPVLPTVEPTALPAPTPESAYVQATALSAPELGSTTPATTEPCPSSSASTAYVHKKVHRKKRVAPRRIRHIVRNRGHEAKHARVVKDKDATHLA